MAGASNTLTTVSNLEKGYKKKATKLYQAFKSRVEEFSWIDDIDDEDITPSGRENLIPLDIKRGYGAAAIPDGGYEAATITPAMNEGSFSFVQYNARFFISRQAQAFDERAKEAQIVRQIRYQSKKSLEGLARKVGLSFYGFSTGIVAKSSTAATATTQTLTLLSAFGVASLGNNTYNTSLFEVGDRIALLSSGSLVTNGLGVIASKGTGTLVVVFDGSVIATSGMDIVFANAVTDATISATDYNRWVTGLLDGITSTSVHGLSSATEPNWAAAVNSTTGGRFGYVNLKAMKQAIMNSGDGQLTDIIWSNGVENDVEAGERAARIYSSSQMDLDGSIKAKGVTFRTSQLVPPGCVFGMDKSGMGKKLLTDKPSEDGSLAFGDLYKAEDRSGYKGGFDLIWATVVRSRAKLAGSRGHTEQ